MNNQRRPIAGRFQRLVSAFVFLFMAILVVPGAGAEAQERSSEVHGEVRSAGVPVRGASVRLEGTRHGGLTDGAGRFRIAGVEPGEYVVEVSHVGHESFRLAITVAPHEGGALAIDLRQQVHLLDEVVVTGQYAPTEARNSIFRVTVLGRERIDQRGATDVGGLLLQELNARVLHDNVLGQNVILQGMSGQNVKILVDGVPLITGESNQVDLAQLNLNEVERVEIIEGPLSVQYGTNALAGTINLITRKPVDGKVRVGVNSYLESVGRYDVDGSVGGEARGIRLLASGGRNQFDGFSSSGLERSKNWNPKTQYFGGVRASRPLGGLTLTASHDHSWEEAVSLGIPTRTPSFAIATDRYFTTVRRRSSAFLNGWIAGGGYVDVVAGFQDHARDNDRYLVNLADNSRRRTDDPRDHSRAGFSTWMARGTYSHGGFAGDRLGFQAGYDVNVHDSEGERVARDRSSITDAGVFLSANLRPAAGIEVQPGFRYLFNNLYDPRDLDFLGMRLPVVPSVNARWAPDGATQLRASYARGFRAPSLRELYYYFHDASHSIDGNPDLVPETAHNVSLAARRTIGMRSGALSVEVMAFDNRVRDRIYLMQKLELRPEDLNKIARTYFNVSEFRTTGANLNLDLDLGAGLRVRPGAGWLARSGTKSAGRAFHSAEATGDVSYRVRPLGLGANLFYKYNGPMAEFSLLEGELVDRTVQGYHLADLSFGRSVLERLEITAGVKNLFDVTEVPQTGRGTEGLLTRGGSRETISVGWGRTIFLKNRWNF